MRHKLRGRKFNRNTAQRTALLKGLTCSLIKHGSIKTTVAKAKDLRPVVEKFVTMAKVGGMHKMRLAAARLYNNQEVVAKLFQEVAPKFKERSGGYCRITKIGVRKGDAAPMAVIEFVA